MYERVHEYQRSGRYDLKGVVVKGGGAGHIGPYWLVTVLAYSAVHPDRCDLTVL